MSIFNPHRDKIKVKEHIAQHNFTKVGLVFLHGLGDTIMFRPVYEALRAELPMVQFTPLVIPNQEPLLHGGLPYRKELDRFGFDAVYVLDFPVERRGYTKAETCAVYELGLDRTKFDIERLPHYPNKQVALHLYGTCLPGSTNPQEYIGKLIHSHLAGEGYLPIDVHFEHAYHNPVNTKASWMTTHVRGHEVTVSKMYSLINNSRWFIGVVSGPLVMAISIDPSRVICLEGDIKIRNFTHHRIPTVDLRRFKIENLKALMQEQ